jgi:hypothetical protein
MIEIIGPNDLLPYGKCFIHAESEAWYQRQVGRRVVMNVLVAQKQQARHWFPKHYSRSITGMVDTGSWYNIIDKDRFMDLGFRVSSYAEGDLGIAGVVNDPTGNNTLWGWREQIRLGPDRTGGIGLPALPMELFVVTNGSKDEFIIGLEFLRKYSLILKDDLLVLDS